jgi:hypothetical protein
VPFSRKRLFHALALPLLAREAGSALTEPERVCPVSIASASGAGETRETRRGDAQVWLARDQDGVLTDIAIVGFLRDR